MSMWLLVNNTLKNIPFKVVYTFFPSSGCSLLRILIPSNISENVRKTSKTFRDIENFRQSSLIFGRDRSLWEAFGWRSLTFRRIRVILGSARKTAYCLRISSGGLRWTSTIGRRKSLNVFVIISDIFVVICTAVTWKLLSFWANQNRVIFELFLQKKNTS